MPAFLTQNIDRAIVMTQFDLRGFLHPFGFRIKGRPCTKYLLAIPSNMVAFAAGLGRKDSPPTDDLYVDSFEASYEIYLSMCKRLASCCDLSQKEAIQIIVKDVVAQAEELRGNIEDPQRLPLLALNKETRWGRVVLSLIDAFEVQLEEVISK